VNDGTFSLRVENPREGSVDTWQFIKVNPPNHAHIDRENLIAYYTDGASLIHELFEIGTRATMAVTDNQAETISISLSDFIVGILRQQRLDVDYIANGMLSDFITYYPKISNNRILKKFIFKGS